MRMPENTAFSCDFDWVEAKHESYFPTRGLYNHSWMSASFFPACIFPYLSSHSSTPSAAFGDRRSNPFSIQMYADFIVCLPNRTKTNTVTIINSQICFYQFYFFYWFLLSVSVCVYFAQSRMQPDVGHTIDSYIILFFFFWSWVTSV